MKSYKQVDIQSDEEHESSHIYDLSHKIQNQLDILGVQESCECLGYLDSEKV